MKEDTFAKLIVLDALVEAEIGYLLEFTPPSVELFREEMVARISDLVDEIDVLDSVAAARVYDSIVDFLAELPDDPEGIVESAARFRRSVDRIVDRGIDRRDLASASTWAVVLHELLDELADEYHLAIGAGEEVQPRTFARVETLLARSRQAADRMLWDAAESDEQIVNDMDRLTFAVRHRRIHPTSADFLIRSLQRNAARYRPSTLTRIGSFVVRQLLRSDGSRRQSRPPPRGTGAGRAGRSRK